MSAFSFRQRVGKLDWKLVSSLSIEDIILHLKISELQAALDQVIFCEFSTVDVKSNSVEATTKLVQLMQLISEYLLHCQEAQFKLIREMNAKSVKHKNTIEKLKHENVSLKEDSKIYQRQLSMLRKSLSNVDGGNFFNAEPGDRCIKLSQNFDHDIENENIRLRLMAVERQEEALRKRQSEIEIEENLLWRREVKIRRELDATPHNVANWQNNDGDTAVLMKDVLARLSSLERQEAAYEIKLAELSQREDSFRRLKENTRTKESGNGVGDILRESALEAQAEALASRASSLDARESALLRREAAGRKEAARERERWIHSNEDGIHGILRQSTSMAARTIASRLFQVLWRRKLHAFHCWFKVCVEERERQQLLEQTRLLKFSSQKRSELERDLQAQLDEQKVANMQAQSRLRILERDLDSRADRPAVPSDSPKRATNELLRAEREKSVLAAAKYNSLLERTAKEQKELSDKLAAAEKRTLGASITRTPKSFAAHTSTATSTEHSAVNAFIDDSSRRGGPAFLLSEFVRDHFLDDASSDQLLLRAQRRVNERRNAAVDLESKAIASLAQELNQKFVAAQ